MNYQLLLNCNKVHRAGNEMFEQGNKVTLMKGNRKIEQRGPLGKTLSRKTPTTLPVDAEERCSFRINL
jgi:hypothetical protein